jgi:hypothetical protein
MALHIADRSASEQPQHRLPVFQSTYLGPPGSEIGQSNSRGVIIALKTMQWEALSKDLPTILAERQTLPVCDLRGIRTSY